MYHASPSMVSELRPDGPDGAPVAPDPKVSMASANMQQQRVFTGAPEPGVPDEVRWLWRDSRSASSIICE
jgi:hypothetical protein